MKANTEIWARFTVGGAPEKTKTVNDSTANVARQFVQWLLSPGVALRSTIQVRIVRHEHELDARETKQNRKDQDLTELQAEIAAMIDAQLESEELSHD